MLTLIDESDRLVFANSRFLAFCGQSLDEIVGQGWMNAIHPEDRPEVATTHLEAFQAHRSTKIEYRIRRFDGEYRWVREAQVARFDEGGDFQGFVGAVIDITDQRQAQEALALQRDALYQSEKLAALGTLLAGVSHELNNPLSVVIGQATLLEETAADAGIGQRAERIRRAAERCSRIVRTFLALARQRHPEFKMVNLNDVVEMGVDLLAYQLRTSAISVALDLEPDLPAVMADPDQLHQVVTNLIVNAQQAMATVEAPRVLSIATRSDGAANLVRLVVNDRGPGLPAEVRTRVFEPFFTTKSAGGGTGIGLSMCHNIVRSHGGRISAGEAPEGGARFIVELPIRAVSSAPPANCAEVAAVVACRILIVDDEAEIAETLREILQRHGYETEVAESGLGALERLEAQPYDIVLSDLRMPGLDGPGLYRRIRERYPSLVCRVAFITGDTLSADIQSFLNEAQVPCLEKPFTTEDVVRLIQSMHRAIA